jgi:sulfite oxidase
VFNTRRTSRTDLRIRHASVNTFADDDWDNLDWSKAPAIQEMPVMSAIVTPGPDSRIATKAESVRVEGYALAGGGRAVIRVDVSVDNGKTWTVATLQPSFSDAVEQYRRHWAWTRWQVR